MTRLVVVLLAFLGAAAPASAHAMRLDWKLTAEALEVWVAFDGEDDLRGRVVVRLVAADTKEPVGQAEPDKSGACTFPRPKPGRYRLVADDGSGHRAERAVEVTADVGTAESKDEARPRGLMVAAGLGLIGVLTLVGYWFAGRKKVAPPAG